MPGLYFHVGLHKTGTTYFQQAVWPRWRGLYYAGKGTNSPVESIESLLIKAEACVVLRSSESNSGSLKNSYLKGGDWLKSTFSKIEELRSQIPRDMKIGIIVTLRRHDRWALSIYKHYLKYGGVDDPDIFFGVGAPGKPTMPIDHLKIMPRLKIIENAFGIYPFCFFLEEVHLRPQELALELASYMGTSEFPSFPDERYNEGVDASQAAVCRIVNALIGNNDCQGKGYINKKHGYGYNLAVRLKQEGLLQSDLPLRLPNEVLKSIKNTCKRDLEDCVTYVTRNRGLGNEIREAVGFFSSS